VYFFCFAANSKNIKRNEKLMKRNNAKNNIPLSVEEKNYLRNKQKMSILFCLEAKWLSLKRNEKLMKQNTAKKMHFFTFA
jgi:hypothetical protein